MSYVQETRRTNSLGMGAAILVNGSIILAVALSPIIAERLPGPTVIQGTHIPEPTPIKNDPKPDDNIAKPIRPIFAPDPIIETKPHQIRGRQRLTNGQILGPSGPLPVVMTRPVRLSGVFPKYRHRYSRLLYATLASPGIFNRIYPVGKLRLEIEGSATVRILVGTDGRVRQVQILNATDPDFARATEKQAAKGLALQAGDP